MEKINIILFSVALIAALYGYIHYGRQVVKRQIKPRPFTWLIWGVLSTCVSVIQINNGADLGVIGALTGAVSGYVLAGMGWYYGRRKIYTTDVVSLSLAVGVLIAWAFVGDDATAIMATATYLIGFIPTIVRGWKVPHNEGQVPFAMSVLKYTISLILLTNVTIATAVYPAVLAVANLAFLVMLRVRLASR